MVRKPSSKLRRRLELASDGDAELPLNFEVELSSEIIAILANRRELHLRNNLLDPHAVELLYARALCVEQLVLEEVEVPDDALVALGSRPPSHPLRRLGIWRCDPETFAWDVLTHAPLGQELTSLSVDTNDAGCAHLLGMPALTTLSVTADLGPRTSAVLRAGPVGLGLRALALCGYARHASRAEELVDALVGWSLPALELLRIQDLVLDGTWPVLLERAAMIASVSELDLGRVKLGTDGVEALASRSLPNLRHLVLWGVTDRGMRAVAAAGWSKTLASLTLIHHRASTATYAEFQAAFPEVKLVSHVDP